MPTSTDLAQITYPESDGQPMADNTKQFRIIVTIQGGLDALFHDDPLVFVAGDLLWYPVESQPKIAAAPDVMVIFGRPKGDRGSYRQWEEEDIAPQVVFEILSPRNTAAAMRRKRGFYERHGVEEYYLYDPETGALSGWQRRGARLAAITPMAGWVSPRLQVRFEPVQDTLQLYGPDGRRFTTYVGLYEQRDQAEERAVHERQRTEQERQRAEQERQRAEQERQRAEQERQRAEQAEHRAAALAAQLRALGIEPA